MLAFESTGFLEVDSKDIQQLCRSTAAVHLGEPERKFTSVHAVLCHYQEDSTSHCCIAFYSKALKKAFVFSVEAPEQKSAWQCGQETLTQLGFQLEDVNLKLSDAMLEVVLRDVPGLLTPQAADNLREENSLLLAELQGTYDKDPDSVQGKKALLKLNSEKRLNAQSEELQQILEEMFVARESENLELAAMENQVKDLNSRLEAAETLIESEREQRRMSESITAAAEKRIKELEEVLVDAETDLSKALKQSQKNTQLQKQVKKLEKELKSAVTELDKTCEKQGQLLEDISRSHERISALENELKETSTAFAKIQAELVEEKTERSRLGEDLEKAEEQVQTIRAELEDAEKKAASHAEVDKDLLELKGRFEDSQQALKESLDLNGGLHEQLASANQQNEEMQERLRLAEKNVRDKDLDEKKLLTLQDELDQRALELKKLHEEFSLERSIRKRLEKGALGEDKRILELEEALAKATAEVAEQVVNKEEPARDDQDMVSLTTKMTEANRRLEAEQQIRQELENELDEAHQLIDSLEKMVRETDSASKERHAHQATDLSENQGVQVQELEEKLKVAEGQLEQERLEQKRLAKLVSAAEKKVLEQSEIQEQTAAATIAKQAASADEAEPVPKKKVKQAKPLPHELRPAPKKGAFFHPDWDLEGLPCGSSKEVLKAWEAVFNVQISLEGYPSQYCMAFLVVLRVKKQKQVYLLYRLKQNKYTLVCVPAKKPKDEASLQKAIKEGLSFLKLSGFEMDDLKKENIDSTLTSYFCGD